MGHGVMCRPPQTDPRNDAKPQQTDEAASLPLIHLLEDLHALGVALLVPVRSVFPSVTHRGLYLVMEHCWGGKQRPAPLLPLPDLLPPGHILVDKRGHAGGHLCRLRGEGTDKSSGRRRVVRGLSDMIEVCDPAATARGRSQRWA